MDIPSSFHSVQGGFWPTEFRNFSSSGCQVSFLPASDEIHSRLVCALNLLHPTLGIMPNVSDGNGGGGGGGGSGDANSPRSTKQAKAKDNRENVVERNRIA
eukprot:TRINITY_DN6264_c0_g2_i1.p1 TRINITY_DN6264_c0_g2~~TRINITY_DN6264_c0_g2_i1.p1  ORF type:complete len:101 (-),score=12.67 TRINITY_DN6264_c0_g2_i1:114-416(-)